MISSMFGGNLSQSKAPHPQQDVTRTSDVTQVVVTNDSPSLTSVKSVPETCAVCFEDDKDMHTLSCSHSFCVTCTSTYIKLKIGDGEVGDESMVCLDPYCKVAISVEDVKEYVSEHLYSKYQKFRFNQQVMQDPNSLWCVNPSCLSVVVVDNSLQKSTRRCTDCRTKLCVRCGNAAHGWKSCYSAMDAGYITWESDHDVAPCPKCNMRIEKNGGCKHMTCGTCHYQFCWYCMMPWRNHRDELCKVLGSNVFGRTRTTKVLACATLGPVAVGMGLGVGATVVGVGVAAAAVTLPFVPAIIISKRRRERSRSSKNALRREQAKLMHGIEIVLHPAEGSDPELPMRIQDRIANETEGRWFASMRPAQVWGMYVQVGAVQVQLVFRVAKRPEAAEAAEGEAKEAEGVEEGKEEDISGDGDSTLSSLSVHSVRGRATSQYNVNEDINQLLGSYTFRVAEELQRQLQRPPSADGSLQSHYHNVVPVSSAADNGEEQQEQQDNELNKEQLQQPPRRSLAELHRELREHVMEVPAVELQFPPQALRARRRSHSRPPSGDAVIAGRYLSNLQPLIRRAPVYHVVVGAPETMTHIENLEALQRTFPAGVVVPTTKVLGAVTTVEMNDPNSLVERLKRDIFTWDYPAIAASTSRSRYLPACFGGGVS